MEKNIRERERNQARKVAQAKKRRRRKALIAVLVSLLVVLAIIFAVISAVLFFKVNEINIKGELAQYTNDAIIKASEIEKQDNLLLLSRKNVIEKINAKLPYIKTVKVEKSLPSKVTIIVTETKDELIISKSGKYYNADKEGKVLSETSTPSESLSIFTFPDDCKVTVGEKIEIENSTLNDLFYKYIDLTNTYNFRINSVDITDAHDSYMTVEGRLKVKMGSPNNFDMKIAHFNTTLLNMSKEAKGTVDLSSYTPEKPEAFFTASDF